MAGSVVAVVMAAISVGSGGKLFYEDKPISFVQNRKLCKYCWAVGADVKQYTFCVLDLRL